MSAPLADSESSLVLELRRSLARLELALAQISNALVIPPSELIAVADSSGLMMPLGQLVLEPSLLAIDPSGAMPDGPSLAVNFSPQQRARPGFAADVLALLSRLELSPRQLCIEVTETALIDYPQRTREELVALRDADSGCFSTTSAPAIQA